MPRLRLPPPPPMPPAAAVSAHREPLDEGGGRATLNVCVVGSAGAGKSTLVGQLLVRSGVVDRSLVQRTEGEAMGAGKGGLRLAWLSDRSREERERGCTITSHPHWQLQTEKYTVHVTDTPGRRKYTRNAITGLQNCDVGVLVVPAPPGEYELSVGKDGAMRDLALLLFALGVRQLIVAVTKMDDKAVAYSKDRFETVRKSVVDFTTKVGFPPPCTAVVPLSGFAGDNVWGVAPSSRMPWYRGPTLGRVLDSVAPPHRPLTRPLRLPVQQVVHLPGIGSIAVGRVEAGRIAVGDALAVPGATAALKVKSLEHLHRTIACADAGAVVGVAPHLPIASLRAGLVLGAPGEQPPLLCKEFEAQVLVLRTPGRLPLVPGYTPLVDIHAAHVACRITSLLLTFDRHTAAVRDRCPTHLTAGSSAVIRLAPLFPLTVEPFYAYPALGRFTLREGNSLLGVGIVRSVINHPAPQAKK